MVKLWSVYYGYCCLFAERAVPKNIHLYPPQGRLTLIVRGREVSKAKSFSGKYEAKQEFPGQFGGGKVETKKLSTGRA